MSLYRYQKLDIASRQVRLFAIHRSDNNKNTPFYSLATYELASCPKHYALSYTWGSPEQQISGTMPTLYSSRACFIEVDSALIQITPNLHSALPYILRALESEAPDLSPYFIWIDAICIDQKSDTERSHQVGIMDEIYSRAESTLVWLGPDVDNSMSQVDVMLTQLSRLDLYSCELATKLNMSPSHVVHEYLLELLAKFDLPPPKDHQWSSFLSAFRRAWFRRLWVIQEVALAQQVKVICGNTIMNWENMLIASWVLNSGLESDILAADLTRSVTHVPIFYGRVLQPIRALTVWCTRPQELPIGFEAICKMLSGTTELTPAAVLPLLICLTNSFSANDPRDKIYALVGILKNLTKLSDGFFKVDYSEPVGDLYTRATKYIIESTNWLGFLSAVYPHRNDQSLPSWVLDFTATAIPLFSVDGDVSINAAGRYRLEPTDKTSSFSISGSTLTTSAFKIATVAAVSEPLDDVFGHQSDFEQGIALLLDLPEIYQYTNEPRIEALWRTLIVNDLKGLDPELWQESFLKWWHVLFLYQAVIAARRGSPGNEYVKTIPNVDLLARSGPKIELTTHATLLDSLEKHATNPAHGNEIIAASRPFSDACGLIIPGHKLLRTTAGHIGLGHTTVRGGDEIWIARRTAVPWVLRLVQNDALSRSTSMPRYVFVGECYLHGIMHGEALDKDEPVWEDVHIV